MASVRILSVNCQGLGNIVKRTDVFNYLIKKQCNIYCLQDTHFTCENEKSIRSSWDYECYFSSFISNAMGTAILFNNNFEFNILKEKRDINGNYLVLDINRGVARHKMKCRHNLRRGEWGPLKAPSRSTKTIVSVNRCTNGEI